MNASSDFHLPPHLRRTVGNPRWMLANAERLQGCFPEQWVPLPQLNALAVGQQLREVGVQFENEIELTLALATLQAAGIMRLAVGRGPFGKADVEVVKRGPLVIVGAS